MSDRAQQLREWRAKNPEKVKAQNKRLYDSRKADPLKHEKKLEANRAWRKQNLDALREYDRARDPIKKNARGLVRNHVHRGKLAKQPCAICGASRTEAHHKDYSKPLDIKWLCSACHAAAHRDQSNV